ncbi:MAG: bifunctional diaminohydroxyphosphoribosylaminopyrimidine deaminase/5-amino-6-(5-phosphoribosylamino)uracil reductase RibD, partial [Alphaproteobacteria bacterium]|nr:bifunctional diaminohydroxyphosphoribosylaminopyrimidine deaminase/5-amino-6-(5-phosphoribosylamino)uracil reductase RibD [Alphaproteobacteria bacterium]
GCVIVSEGERIVGRGWTQPGGRPHAETVALEAAGAQARGATCYVTLEPCAHHGTTPPCADALVAAGVARVVAAVEDPDPRVRGKGFARLKDAGIEVATGVLENEAAHVNQGFFLRIREHRPLVTLKVAQSLDGKIALANGQSRWITGDESRRFAHLLRAQNDAILVGIGTALIDDPMLSCRLEGLEDRSPMRVILDAKGRLKSESRLAQSAREIPVLLATAGPKRPDLEALGVEVIAVEQGSDGRVVLPALLKLLAGRGITRLLVEGGAQVHAAFLKSGLCDRMEIFTAPIVLGSDALGSPAALALADLKHAPGFKREQRRVLGPDLLESFARRA